jgi:GT2 family glycosyltransferase
MTERIYILVPVHNRCEITRNFIDSLRLQTYQNYHLILINDGSTDDTEKMVRQQIKNLTVIRGNGNWWWAGSLQQGINWLKTHNIKPSDIVLLINDDTVIPSDFLKIGRDLLQKLPHSLLQSQIRCLKTGELLDNGFIYDPNHLSFTEAKDEDSINCLTTNGLFIRWNDVKGIGNFYPKILPHYLSDYEYTFRAYKKGLKLHVSPLLQLWWNKETTGFRHVEREAFFSFLKKYFSKKSAANPIYWSNFILLTCPVTLIPLHMLRIWKTALIMAYSHLPILQKSSH